MWLAKGQIMTKMVIAIIVKGSEPINSLVLSEDDAEKWFAEYDGITVVPDPNDDFSENFITLTGCIAVDVTGLDPMPGLGIGWKYVDGEWIPPVIEENEIE